MPDEVQDSGLESLGTPPDLRAPQPVGEPAPIQKALDPHRVEEWHERRRGLAGIWDSVAYHVQVVLLLIYGAGEQTREADPVERLKRKYGRAPRPA